MSTGFDARSVQIRRKSFVKDFVDQTGFSGTGDTRDAGHNTQRNLDRDVFQIVLGRTNDLQIMAVERAALFRNRDLFAAGKILSSDAAVSYTHLLDRKAFRRVRT